MPQNPVVVATLNSTPPLPDADLPVDPTMLVEVQPADGSNPSRQKITVADIIGGGGGVAGSGTATHLALWSDGVTIGDSIITDDGSMATVTGDADITGDLTASKIDGPVGTAAPAAGKFTTLAASGAVSGAGFNALLASPPAIGGTAAAAGSFTTLAASGAATTAGITDSTHVKRSVGNALTAVGTNRATALLLTKDINNVTTAGAGTGVQLPVGVVGMEIDVFIDGGVVGAVVQVYAAASETIDTVAGATGVPLTKGLRCRYVFVAANTWISAQWGVVSG